MPEYDNNNSQFTLQLMQIGILSYREQETLRDIAIRCAKTAGMPMAGALMGITTLPGVSTIARGTLVDVSQRDALRKLASAK
ncbi:MAG: hypothetical protein V4577_27135 [Bacteroidota bacterium]